MLQVTAEGALANDQLVERLGAKSERRKGAR